MTFTYQLRRPDEESSPEARCGPVQVALHGVELRALCQDVDVVSVMACMVAADPMAESCPSASTSTGASLLAVHPRCGGTPMVSELHELSCSGASMLVHTESWQNSEHFCCICSEGSPNSAMLNGYELYPSHSTGWSPWSLQYLLLLTLSVLAESSFVCAGAPEHCGSRFREV